MRNMKMRWRSEGHHLLLPQDGFCSRRRSLRIRQRPKLKLQKLDLCSVERIRKLQKLKHIWPA